VIFSSAGAEGISLKSFETFLLFILRVKQLIKN
jgi:hypothetical protein